MDQGEKSKLIERLSMTPFAVCLGLHILFTLLNAKPIGDDSYLHPMWLELFSEQFRAGDLYPRWLFETYGSFGSPTFYLYPPLTYFFGAVISLLGTDSGVTLYNIIQYLALLLSGYTSYLLFKQLSVSRSRAFIGALVYVFNPYHFVDVFARSALSEHVALAFLPLVFLGFEKISHSERVFRGIATMLVGWTLLILTNIPTLCVTGIGVLVMIYAKRDVKLLGYSAVAFIVALALSAFYWLPAYRFSQFTRTEALWSFTSKTLPDQILVVLMIVTILFLIAARTYNRKLSDASELRGWLTLATVALVLMVPFVTDLLYTIYPFKLIQFNWRFTMLAMLALTVLMVKAERYARIAMPVVGLSTMALYLIYGFTYVFRDVSSYEQPIKRDAPEYTTKWVPYHDSVLIPFLQKEDNAIISSEEIPGLAISDAYVNASGLSASLRSSSSGTIRLHQFYWPEWSVWLGSERLPIAPDAHGFLTAELPAGNGRLTASMQESPIERTSKWISIVSLFAMTIAIGAMYSNSKKRS